jgi:hypothetical protein
MLCCWQAGQYQSMALKMFATTLVASEQLLTRLSKTAELQQHNLEAAAAVNHTLDVSFAAHDWFHLNLNLNLQRRQEART